MTFKEEVQQLSAYPNPFIQSLEISVVANLEQTGLISLQDLNGKEVWATERQLLQGNNRLIFTIPEALAKGIYVLKVQLAQNSKSIKLGITQMFKFIV